jgi:hypothetical protein
MAGIDLKLMLSSARNQSGILIVQERETGHVLAQFEALGRGSQGGADTQMQVNGNTPTGTYRVERIEDTASWNQSSYGPHGALRLAPASGNALAAEQCAGRAGLLIHGGTPGGATYWRGANELRATHGCVRLSNDNMRRLVDILQQAGADPHANQSRAVEVTLTVTDHEMSFARP